MARRTLLAVVTLALAALTLLLYSGACGSHRDDHAAAGSSAAAAPAGSGSAAPSRGSAPDVPAPSAAPSAAPALVTIRGTVIDRDAGTPVAGVEVVIRGALGDTTATAATDGTYSVKVAPGTYRAFVRDSLYLVSGAPERVRLDGEPRGELANLPDEGLMPALVARADVANVEIPVVRGGSVIGTVLDEQGHPVAHAIVRARGTAERPALGTDIVESDDHGAFRIQAPPGRYELDASHAKFAEVVDKPLVDIAAGAQTSTTLQLAKGCVIRGRVVHADGTPSNEGAIETTIDPVRDRFAAASRVEPDGTFHFATAQSEPIRLRAWPWKSAPSSAKTFDCHPGARYDNVVLTLPDRAPDIAGDIVDAQGNAVPLAYLDVRPLDGQIAQQERADAAGHWGVYDMLPGRYEITATAPGRGVVRQMVVAPRTDVHLQLGGTGRIAGTTTSLVDGTLELAFIACDRDIAISHEPRLVTVHGGRFTVDDVPACSLVLAARWRNDAVQAAITVEPDGTTPLQLDLGPPHAKTLHGLVRDAHGAPAANVRVTATSQAARAAVSATTDAAGTYTLRSYAGAQVVASSGDDVATATAGRSNVPEEQIDLALAPRP